MEDNGKVVLGLLAGVAIGATLGILFAPDKGSETRKKIASRKRELEEDLEDKFDAFLEDMKKKFETVKQEAGDEANDIQQNIETSK